MSRSNASTSSSSTATAISIVAAEAALSVTSQTVPVTARSVDDSLRVERRPASSGPKKFPRPIGHAEPLGSQPPAEFTVSDLDTPAHEIDGLKASVGKQPPYVGPVEEEVLPIGLADVNPEDRLVRSASIAGSSSATRVSPGVP